MSRSSSSSGSSWSLLLATAPKSGAKAEGQLAVFWSWWRGERMTGEDTTDTPRAQIVAQKKQQKLKANKTRWIQQIYTEKKITQQKQTGDKNKKIESVAQWALLQVQANAHTSWDTHTLTHTTTVKRSCVLIYVTDERSTARIHCKQFCTKYEFLHFDGCVELGSSKSELDFLEYFLNCLSC